MIVWLVNLHEKWGENEFRVRSSLERCDSARRRFPKKSILVFWYLISFSFSVSLCFLRVLVLDISLEWRVSEHSFIDNSISAPCHFFILRKIGEKTSNLSIIDEIHLSTYIKTKNSSAFMSSLNIISSWLTVFISPHDREMKRLRRINKTIFNYQLSEKKLNNFFSIYISRFSLHLHAAVCCLFILIHHRDLRLHSRCTIITFCWRRRKKSFGFFFFLFLSFLWIFAFRGSFLLQQMTLCIRVITLLSLSNSRVELRDAAAWVEK